MRVSPTIRALSGKLISIGSAFFRPTGHDQGISFDSLAQYNVKKVTIEAGDPHQLTDPWPKGNKTFTTLFSMKEVANFITKNFSSGVPSPDSFSNTITEKHFRRIDGHANLRALAAILGRKTETSKKEKVA